MSPAIRSIACRYIVLLGLVTSVAVVVSAQGPPVVPVRYTEARSHAVRRDVTLPGTVEARKVSLVASEVTGPVVELRAREGYAVTQGEILAQISTSNLELQLRATQGQLKEARSRRRRAENVLSRAKELHGQELIADEEFDDAYAEFHAWQGRVDALEAESARLELDLERCHIKSPLTGVVVSERVEVGEWLDVGEPVVEIVTLQELDVRVDVPARFFHLLQVDDPARVSFESMPDMAVQGRISSLIPRADRQARTFPIKVSIENEDLSIAAGLLASVSLPAGEPYEAVIVPKDAIISQGGQTFVLLIDDEDVAQQIPVTTGDGAGSWIAVTGDVALGQRVVTRGNERLFPGQKVAGEPLEYDLP